MNKFIFRGLLLIACLSMAIDALNLPPPLLLGETFHWLRYLVSATWAAIGGMVLFFGAE